MRYLTCGVTVYAWGALLVAGAILLNGCVAAAESPRLEGSCDQYVADMMTAPPRVPSLERAAFGVRVVVAADFQDFQGVSFPITTGRLVMEPWVYHWFDGDHLGALGIDHDQPDLCRWYEPLP
jgi:hypothetical protein